ncbi:MAG: signal peptidase II [Lachnospiraceae bacterium]|nr:signal peptidase II [Lachnospiraceae bacterium]MCH4030472.1 signal peptidase II [Lachnospiraceae bacterium]MCH4069682.1 signal peptidase II [Lachnospiraceae bacterium]MCH4107380.1 signal peptidase II [Lachnospiraceae bacterium]MCI1301766.1 signal peptidase II [Lachnospiraceae bacterium]
MNKTSLAKKLLWMIIPSALLILLDQFTKIEAAARLAGKSPFVIIPGALEFYYIENTGAAWGMMAGARTFFIILTVIVIAAVVYVVMRIPDLSRYKMLMTSAVFLIAGAVGNLIDRVILHYVRDFIYFSLIDFPVFNVADMCVTACVIALIIGICFIYRNDDFAFLRLHQNKQRKAEDGDRS